MAEANEREEVKALLPQIPHGRVLLFDRGYPSYDLLEHLQHQYHGLWVLRCPASPHVSCRRDLCPFRED